MDSLSSQLDFLCKFPFFCPIFKAGHLFCSENRPADFVIQGVGHMQTEIGFDFLPHFTSVSPGNSWQLILVLVESLSWDEVFVRYSSQ